MATTAAPHRTFASDDRFFLIMAILMAVTGAAGFLFLAAIGISTFHRPWYVHLHAGVFMGWLAIYVLQNILVTRGSMALHRALGWTGAVWIVAMFGLGTAVTVAMVQRGQAPFFFTPLHFLIFDPMTVLTFAGLTWAAIAMRRRTEWHRRLHYCGTAMLMIPSISRLEPSPLMTPYAFEGAFLPMLLFPAIGMIADLRRSGRVHPAWWWGVGAMLGSFVVTEALTYSPAGTLIYDAVTAGTPGASVPPLAFGTPPAP